MDIAYLLLTHNRPRHFARLLRALADDGVHFFVHVDAKTEIAPFLEAASGNSKVTFLPSAERVAVFWSGYSTIEATLKLLRVARRAANPAYRYALLSGADYPIKPKSHIRKALMSDTEFIRIDQHIEPSGKDLYSRRVRYPHLYDHPLVNPRTTRNPRFASIVGKLFNALPRAQFPTVPLYQGSAWWALTAPCVDFVLKFVEDNPAYARFHRYSSTPDEIFFHSIVMASPFRAKICHDGESRAGREQDKAGRDDHASHFIDWVTPGIDLPKILDISDLDRILCSKALFARKFQSPRSDALLSALKKKLRKASKPPTENIAAAVGRNPAPNLARDTAHLELRRFKRIPEATLRSELSPTPLNSTVRSWNILLEDFRRRYGATGVAFAIRSAVSMKSYPVAFKPKNHRFPLHLRTHSTDLKTFDEVFLERAYAIDLIHEPRVIVDCGANIGLASIDLALQFPNARIIALESDAENFELCAMNCAPYPQITPLHLAVWNEEGVLNVYDPGEEHGEWGFRVEAAGGEAGRISRGSAKSVTIGTLMQKQNIEVIDLLKVDVEGAELEIFTDASAWIDRVRVIIVECHERFRPGSENAVLAATSQFAVKRTQGQNYIVARAGCLKTETRNPA